MKLRAPLCIVLAALAAPQTRIFAADNPKTQEAGNSDIIALSVKGSVGTVSADGKINPIKAGQSLVDGATVQTGANASAQIRLGDGTIISIGANSRVKLKLKAPKPPELVLLRGTIAGTFAPGVSVVTAGGFVTPGANATVQYTPSGVGTGTLIVGSASGVATIRLQGDRAPIKVPTGNSLTVSPNGTPTPGVLTPDQIESITNKVARDYLAEAAEEAAKRKPATPPPITSTVPANLSQLQGISPNGES